MDKHNAGSFDLEKNHFHNPSTFSNHSADHIWIPINVQ